MSFPTRLSVICTFTLVGVSEIPPILIFRCNTLVKSKQSNWFMMFKLCRRQPLVHSLSVQVYGQNNDHPYFDIF